MKYVLKYGKVGKVETHATLGTMIRFVEFVEPVTEEEVEMLQRPTQYEVEAYEAEWKERRK